MNKLYIFIFLLSQVLFFSCGAQESERERNARYRDNGDRVGKVDRDKDDEEKITDDPDGVVNKVKNKIKIFFENTKNCESSVSSTSANQYDLGFRFFGLTNPLSKFRECLVQKLEETSKSICEYQKELDTELRKVRGYDEREERIEAAYDVVLEAEDKYRADLLELSNRLDDQAERQEIDFFAKEYESLAQVIYYESELRCKTRYDNR